ncbi:MAG: hypothetical protein EA382_16925 [Spirochaetaceae bacterium]|nr:MAG: hypothetical protein EA382_16925 [Spirochaetaceae bacterium]
MGRGLNPDEACMKKQKVLYSFASADLASFEEQARSAADLGATHVYISQIEKSRWLWERDRSDPYPNWSMLLTSLFKIIRPEPIAAHLPAEFSDRNYRYVAQKSEIATRLGLRCAMLLKEPFFLPEAVFREHPGWRGPRCDHPRRARNHYFSPCVDHPEVLAMYHDAVELLCRDTGTDYIQILTNDSGGGLCWSSGLYSGANGPAHCRSIPMAQRIGGFLDTFQAGAAAAGVELEVEINSNIGYKENEHIMDGVWPHLAAGQTVNGKDRRGRLRTGEATMNYDYTLMPVRNVVQPFAFLRALEEADRGEFANLRVVLTPTDFGEYHFLLREYARRPTRGPVDRARIVGRLAATIAGRRHAHLLAQAWQLLDEAIEHFRDTALEGLVSCAVNQRWINRPFVLFPGELAPEETAYWRPFLFQANDEAHANDLLDIQNSSFIRGYSGVFIAVRALDKAIAKFTRAADLVSMVAHAPADTAAGADAPAADDQSRARLLALHADRIRLLCCFMRNAKNAIIFQHVVDTTDYDRTPEVSPEWPLDAERNLLRFEEISRSEIDTANDIIRLISGREAEMLDLAPTHEIEDVFLLSPRIADQLRAKTHIMLDRLLDGKRLWETHNH